MTQRTIAHLYDRYDDAQKVVHDLEASGVPHSEISLISNAERQSVMSDTAPAGGSGVGAGAVAGTAIGGGLGLAAGLGALAIPGVGPVVAAGWLAALLAGAGVGAAAGSLVGALTGAGLSREEADVYAEGVRSGGTLVTVRTSDAEVTRVEDIMGRHSPVDWRQRRATYGDRWTGFDETRSVAVDPVEEVRPHDELGTGTASRDELAERSATAVPERGGGTPPAATPPNIPEPGTDGAFAPGTRPSRRL